MSVKVIGLIKLANPAAFEVYRGQVVATVERYQGTVVARGSSLGMVWNELHCGTFDTFVEIHFPTKTLAETWATSPEYQALLPIRQEAMQLTLFMVE